MGLLAGVPGRAPRRCVWAALVVAMAVNRVSAFAEAGTPASGPGVSRALAVERAARVAEVRYELEFAVQPHASVMHGREVLRFSLTGDAGDLPLDFRDGKILSVELNGEALAPLIQDGDVLLPRGRLRGGQNEVSVEFESRVAQSGAAITRYEDKDDGSEYLYSLFVPMDASMAFPCFDQPDLKARFTLSVSGPAEWVVLSNTAAAGVARNGETSVTRFAETKPISTYLFAFAAGPWVSVHDTPGQPHVYVRRSQVERARPEVPHVQETTTRGMRWLEAYFQQPFPFPKYDIVLIPGFPFGGMEHAGVTFLREDGVLFRSAPTASDRFQRDILTLHELTHQWFGDLVTMRWFDDLWLKEGFAQYMAYRARDALQPDANAWKHFYEEIKPQAYGIDETEGTTPIFQQIPNLKDAKSAYGAIVYQKAPSILKQLDFWLGAESFRDGLRLYLKQHAYGNAQWSDLIDALHATSGQDVRAWADAWVLRRGMPEVDVSWNCDAGGRLAALTLHQHDVLPDSYVWPISNEVLLGYATDGREPIPLRVSWDTAEKTVMEAAGKPCPAYVFANSGDFAYGRFLLDEKSEGAVRHRLLAGESSVNDRDPLLRSMLWGALWDNVHVAKSPPRGFVELVLANLPHEQDEMLARIQGGHAVTALDRYLSTATRRQYAPRLEEIAIDRMLHAETAGLRIVSFRTLTSVAQTPIGLGALKQLLDKQRSVPGVELRQLDRWNMVGRLISQSDPNAQEYFAKEEHSDHSGDGQKYAWAVRAGAADGRVKEEYFAAYRVAPTDPAAKPEDWLTQSLRPFNSWNQIALTEPFLERALDQLPEIKRDRKIFFLGAWLGAFIDGQTGEDAEAVVNRWLAQSEHDADLRLKVLEHVDELRRAVLIRRTYPE